MGKRILIRQLEGVPEGLWFRLGMNIRVELVPCAWRSSAGRTNTASQDIQEMKGARDCPASKVTAACAAPHMRGKLRTSLTYFSGNLHNHCSLDSTLFFCILRSIDAVLFFQRLNKIFKSHWSSRVILLQILLPVHPVFKIVAVVEPLINNNLCHGKQDSWLTAWKTRHPVVRHAGRV